MAILRGGRRIFGTDIRFGIPRDRSLDNVQNDPRLRRVQGNPESTIGRFQAKMSINPRELQLMISILKLLLGR